MNAAAASLVITSSPAAGAVMGAGAGCGVGASGWSANTDGLMIDFLTGGGPSKGGSSSVAASGASPVKGALSSWGRPLSAAAKR